MEIISQSGARLFRANSGTSWTGTLERYDSPHAVILHPGDVVLRQARPFHGLPKGTSDLIGIASDGTFLAIEAKSGNARPTKEQKAFIEMVNKLGGRAGVARTPEDALRIIKGG